MSYVSPKGILNYRNKYRLLQRYLIRRKNHRRKDLTDRLTESYIANRFYTHFNPFILLVGYILHKLPAMVYGVWLWIKYAT